MGKAATAATEELPENIEDLKAALAAKEQEIADQKALIEALNARIVELESQESQLGDKLNDALKKVDEKLQVLEVKGRKVRALRRTIRFMGRIIVFSQKVLEVLKKKHPTVPYVLWSDLPSDDQVAIIESLDSDFEDVKGKDSKTA
jgi:chromosome segregation ATPase